MYCPPETQSECLTFCSVVASSPTTIGGGSEGMGLIDSGGGSFEGVDSTDNIEW